MTESPILHVDAKPRRIEIRRHSLATRVTHWVNVVCLAILLGSGLQIFNAHPALYWGNISTFAHPFLTLPDFPSWTTMPSYRDLGSGRMWHFFFAWVLVLNATFYLIATLRSRHLSRDLLPTLEELRNTGHSLIEHARLRFPKGDEARRYNVVQKLTYLFVIFGLLPLIILTGLCMSPYLNAILPWLPAAFGGRQSARTFHFIAASGLVVFIFVHLAMVFLSGFANNIRSMITGRYVIEGETR